MNKSLLVTVVSGLLLSACAINVEPSGSAVCPPVAAVSVDAHNPRLAIIGGKQIVVNQEPLYFPQDVKNVRITWNAPANSDYTFGKDGIVIEKAGEEIVDCRPSHDGKSFSCLNRHTKPGRYKYTIKLEGKVAVAPLDPIIINGD